MAAKTNTETKGFDYTPATGKLEWNKSHSSARIVIDGSSLATIYPRKNHSVVYFRADDVTKAPGKGKLGNADGNGAYNRKLAVTDAKAAKLADDLLAFVAAAKEAADGAE